MGKITTAARYARSGNKTKKTSRRKIQNKRQQRTPKTIRKQNNKIKLSRQQEIEQIKGKAEKRMNSLNFKTFTTNIKNELYGNYDDNQNDYKSKKNLSRSERNKFSRINKKSQKAKEQEDKKNNLIDFTSYDRKIDSNNESSSDSDNDDENAVVDKDQHLVDMEMGHKPKSWDTRKSKLSYQSGTGKWIIDSEQIDQHYIGRDDMKTKELKKAKKVKNEIKNKQNKHDDEYEEDEVIITQNEITDYLNLGKQEDLMQNDDNDDEDEDEDEDEDDDINMDDKNILNDDEIQHIPLKKLTTSEYKIKKKQRFNQIKLEIADIGEKILQDPYRNCALLEILFNLCNDGDIVICQLSMLSLTTTIIDIMPPYKIDTIQSNIALKKRNERVREFEKILLNSYQSYLKYIFKLARIFHSNTRSKTKKKDPKRFILGKCAIKCILLFIRKCSHFNYTKELIKNTIPLLNCSAESIRREACGAMAILLKYPPINNVTVECVQLICAKIEKKNFEIYPDIINILGAVPLKYLEAPQDDYKEEKIKPTKSRWEKQFDKQQKKDSKELEGLNKKKMYSRQKVIISSVFGVYFYILKLSVPIPLLEAALKGMSKFAHLINIELLLDLISILSEKLKNEKKQLSTTCKLQCIITTFKCLSGRGSSIEMDVKEHYITIYELLLSITNNIYEWQTNFKLMFECLTVMFGKGSSSKSLSIERISSFIKRLINISTQLPPHYAIPCMHIARKLIITDPRLYNMLNYEGGYDKEYNAFINNPDYANSLSQCLWELSNTSSHYHTFNKTYSRDLASFNEIPLKLSLTPPEKIMFQYDMTKIGNFRPFVIKSKLSKYSMIKHPPQDINNIESMKNMVNWFKVKHRSNKNYNKQEKKLKKITKAVMNGNNMSNKAIAYYSECGDLITKNAILKELNTEFKLLNQLLQND